MCFDKNRIELECPGEVFRRVFPLIFCAQDLSNLILGRCIARVDYDLLFELIECVIILIVLLILKKDHPNSVMQMRSLWAQLKSLPIFNDCLGRTVLSLERFSCKLMDSERV